MTNINTFQGDVFIHEYIKHTGDDNNLFGFSGTDTFKIVTAGADGLTVNSSQTVTLGGSLVIPSYVYHTGDTNTYFGFSGADTIVMRTAGSDRLTVKADGNVGIGTNAPSAPFVVYADSDNYFGWNPGVANDTSIVDHTALGATSFRKQHFMKMGGRQWYWGYVNDSNGSFGLAFDGGGGNDPDIVAVFNTSGDLYINDLFAEEVTATTITGALTGNASSATNVRVDRDDTGDTTMYLTMVNNNTAENSKRLYMDTNLIYDNTNNRLRLNQVAYGDQNVYGLAGVSGTYGTVQTFGTGKGSYEGYSINGEWVFMSNGAGECGIYNDTNNEWQLQCHQNGATNLYYNGTDKFQTTNDGAHVTGALYADHFYVDDYIYHNGDTNTRIGFGGNDTIYLRTGGGDRIIIDSSGRVRMPQIPCFNAHRAGGNFRNSEIVALPFNGTDINNGGHYSTSNYRFTAPVNGSYAFHGQGLHRKINGNGTVEPTFYQNNGNTSNRGQGFSHMIDSAEQVTNIHIVRAMNASQYMTHGISYINSVTDYYYGERLGGFSGYLLG